MIAFPVIVFSKGGQAELSGKLVFEEKCILQGYLDEGCP